MRARGNIASWAIALGAVVTTGAACSHGSSGAAPAVDSGSTGGSDAGATDAGADAGDVESIAPVPTCTLSIPPPGTCPSGVVCAKDVTYATVGTTPLLLDFARPQGAGPFPVVVVIHGGGFVKGDKADRDTDMLVLAQNGFAAASINYRLMLSDGTNDFPTAIQDARCAVRSIRANAAKLLIDPARLGVMGTSAGAVLTGILATESDVAGLDEPCGTASNESVAIKAAAPFYGAFNVHPDAPLGSDTSANAGVAQWLHQPPDDPTIDALASAIDHLDSSDPPFLLVHGDADTTIPVAQSEKMTTALHAVGVPATLIVVPGAPHAFDPMQAVAPYEQASCTALAFFKKWL